MNDEDRRKIELVTSLILLIAILGMLLGAILSLCGCYIPNAPADEIQAMRKMLNCEFQMTEIKRPADEEDQQALSELREKITDLLNVWEGRLSKTWLQKPVEEKQ